MANKEYKFQGETFHIDDSKPRLIRVAYAEDPQKVGWAGVNIGERDQKYPYAITLNRQSFTEKGVTIANGGRAETVEDAINQCCKLILRTMERREFDAEAAADELHDWFDKQP